jgi:hypothetical protein
MLTEKSIPPALLAWSVAVVLVLVLALAWNWTALSAAFRPFPRSVLLLLLLLLLLPPPSRLPALRTPQTTPFLFLPPFAWVCATSDWPIPFPFRLLFFLLPVLSLNPQTPVSIFAVLIIWALLFFFNLTFFCPFNSSLSDLESSSSTHIHRPPHARRPSHSILPFDSHLPDGRDREKI